jgi:predicted nucleotidyltransferase
LVLHERSLPTVSFTNTITGLRFILLVSLTVFPLPPVPFILHTSSLILSRFSPCPSAAKSRRIRNIMGIEELLRERREEILRIAARHGAHNVRIFGSVARGEAGPQSDIDLLVDVDSHTSSWFPTGLIDDLEQLLGRKVDVLTDGGVSPYLRDQIYREAVPL